MMPLCLSRRPSAPAAAFSAAAQNPLENVAMDARNEPMPPSATAALFLHQYHKPRIRIDSSLRWRAAPHSRYSHKRRTGARALAFPHSRPRSRPLLASFSGRVRSIGLVP